MRIVFLYMKNIDNGSGSEFGKIQYNSNAKSWVLTLSQMLPWIMTPDTAGNSHARTHYKYLTALPQLSLLKQFINNETTLNYYSCLSLCFIYKLSKYWNNRSKGHLQTHKNC